MLCLVESNEAEFMIGQLNTTVTRLLSLLSVTSKNSPSKPLMNGKYTLRVANPWAANPAHFGRSWATRWSYSAKSKNTSGQWVLEGVCQISNLKSKK
jgi:hypothetical protein